MIPIECPKCGRGGSVPPDRLNARLVCKACHSVFHLDNTGRMVMGEPESFDMKSTKQRKEEAPSAADIDLAQAWKDIPAPVRYGVPGVLLAVILYLNFAPGAGAPDYVSRAQTLIGAVLSNDKSKAVSIATSDSAAAAGQWFDLVHADVEKAQIGPDVLINPQLFSGNAEKDTTIILLVVLAKSGSTDPPLTINLPMRRDGGGWSFDATQSLEAVQKAASTATRKK